MNNVFYVGGSKGGVGKSVVSIAVADLLISRGLNPVIVETDTANPDVGSMYNKFAFFADLDDRDGWLRMIAHIEANADRPFLINSAARANTGLEKYGRDLFFDSLVALGRECTAFWVTNRTKDSVTMLADFLEMSAGVVPVHAVRNMYFGSAQKFELLNTSKTLEAAIKTGGLVLDFPDLADRVYEKLNVQRWTVEHALEPEMLSIGDKVELMRWRREANRCFEEVIHA